MLFNSISFIIFFIIVTTTYFLLPHKYRWSFLLIASCYFYMSLIPIYILILFLTITVDYYAAIKIEQGKHKKFWLVGSLISTILILFVFKYYNFFGTNFNYIASVIGWNYSINFLKIVLPIGLSFHTFQSMSYVIEVYYGRFKAEKHYGIYALYVMFYPQLVAGPIERPQNLLHQFYDKHYYDYKRITDGLKLMLWGFFKKIVIADRLALYVNLVYNNVYNYSGFSLIFATIFFAFQIYYDFSGYSDIAIGSAKIMGFDLMTNFNRPYKANTIQEFWKRWHISLSTWFRDYVYIPLGGNRVSKYRWYFNIFIVFMISGLWHGANWTFVIWGTIHGLAMVITTIYPIRNRIISYITTMFIVFMAWIFFRANTLQDAIYVITNMIPINFKWNGITLLLLIYGFMLIIFFETIMEYIKRNNFFNNNIFRTTIYISVIIILLLFGVFGNNNFIYFQF
jgi:alginate O-acetyltransferase complex protein AlgI